MPETDLRTVTETEVRRELDILLRDQPGNSNGESCQYTRVDGGHCVVGTVLHNLNLPLPNPWNFDEDDDNIVAIDASRFENEANGASVDTDIFLRWTEDHGYQFESAALDVLHAVQTTADRFVNADTDQRNQWGHAIRIGFELVESGRYHQGNF